MQDSGQEKQQKNYNEMFEDSSKSYREGVHRFKDVAVARTSVVVGLYQVREALFVRRSSTASDRLYEMLESRRTVRHVQRFYRQLLDTQINILPFPPSPNLRNNPRQHILSVSSVEDGETEEDELELLSSFAILRSFLYLSRVRGFNSACHAFPLARLVLEASNSTVNGLAYVVRMAARLIVFEPCFLGRPLYFHHTEDTR